MLHKCCKRHYIGGSIVSLESVSRTILLKLAKSKFLKKALTKNGLKFGADRFVAGLDVETTIKAVQELNKRGILATMDQLGEGITRPEEAKKATQGCIEILEGIHKSGVDANLSLKLTQLGLELSKDLCMENMQKIIDVAKKYDIFVRIDMEDSPLCDVTLEITKFFKAQHDKVGTVLQSYLYRAIDDMKDVEKLNMNLRLVKGAYKEPKEVAFPEKKDVDENFKVMIRQHMDSGCYLAVATHDEALCEYAIQYAKEKKIPKEQFEIQFLYGIRNDLHKKYSEAGYTVRLYVPFGHDWYPYNMRRLAERPANVWFVLKNLFKG